MERVVYLDELTMHLATAWIIERASDGLRSRCSIDLGEREFEVVDSVG